MFMVGHEGTIIALLTTGNTAGKTLLHFFSTGRPAFTQAFHPPWSADTSVKPNSVSSCATRALVASLGQEQ
jgi:hypothetical protein